MRVRVRSASEERGEKCGSRCNPNRTPSSTTTTLRRLVLLQIIEEENSCCVHVYTSTRRAQKSVVGSSHQPIENRFSMNRWIFLDSNFGSIDRFLRYKNGRLRIFPTDAQKVCWLVPSSSHLQWRRWKKYYLVEERKDSTRFLRLFYSSFTMLTRLISVLAHTQRPLTTTSLRLLNTSAPRLGDGDHTKSKAKEKAADDLKTGKEKRWIDTVASDSGRRWELEHQAFEHGFCSSSISRSDCQRRKATRQEARRRQKGCYQTSERYNRRCEGERSQRSSAETWRWPTRYTRRTSWQRQ